MTSKTVRILVEGQHEARLAAEMLPPDAAGAARFALEKVREVLRREGLEQYVGEDNFVDPDGVVGIGDLVDAALSKLGKGTP